ncbi:MAG: GNAT family N-acetyltransferase [Pirellula sp.]|jgi:RimJ/RimL family protein N-acetyltransferase
MNPKQLQVSIRDLLKDDANLAFNLRCDPRLRGMQYAPSMLETPETYFAVMQPGTDIPTVGFKCSTVLVDSIFAGHISEACSTSKFGTPVIQLGWNLVPELWGKGIMVQALDELFGKRFAARQDIEFVACAFSKNQRSIRVIEKLGFTYAKLTISEWLYHVYHTRGTKRVLKYCLSYDLWNSRGKRESALTVDEAS